MFPIASLKVACVQHSANAQHQERERERERETECGCCMHESLSVQLYAFFLSSFVVVSVPYRVLVESVGSDMLKCV